MTPLLAQGDPSPQAVYQAWLVLIAIVGVASSLTSIIGVIYLIVSRRKERREVSFEFNPAAKEEFERHKTENALEHKEIWSRIHAEREATEKSARDRTGGLYTKLDELRRENKADLATQTTDLHKKIEGIPERILNMLRHIKEIGGPHHE